MLFLVAVSAALALCGLVGAQSPFIGKCPTTKYQANFDYTKYFVGRWYEQKRFFAIFEINQKCVEAEYKVLPNGYVQVNNSGFATNKGERVNQLGQAYCDKDPAAACHVRFYEAQPWGAYSILSTDYESYSVVYSCRDVVGSLATQLGWILTRQPQVDASIIQHAMEVYQSNGINAASMEAVAQDCGSS